jgi:hypothetical protein
MNTPITKTTFIGNTNIRKKNFTLNIQPISVPEFKLKLPYYRQSLAIYDYQTNNYKEIHDNDIILPYDVIFYSYLLVSNNKEKIAWWSDLCPMTGDLEYSVFRCTSKGEKICPV